MNKIINYLKPTFIIIMVALMVSCEKEINNDIKTVPGEKPETPGVPKLKNLEILVNSGENTPSREASTDADFKNKEGIVDIIRVMIFEVIESNDGDGTNTELLEYNNLYRLGEVIIVDGNYKFETELSTSSKKKIYIIANENSSATTVLSGAVIGETTANILNNIEYDLREYFGRNSGNAGFRNDHNKAHLPNNFPMFVSSPNIDINNESTVNLVLRRNTAKIKLSLKTDEIIGSIGVLVNSGTKFSYNTSHKGNIVIGGSRKPDINQEIMGGGNVELNSTDYKHIFTLYVPERNSTSSEDKLKIGVNDILYDNLRVELNDLIIDTDRLDANYEYDVRATLNDKYEITDIDIHITKVEEVVDGGEFYAHPPLPNNPQSLVIANCHIAQASSSSTYVEPNRSYGFNASIIGRVKDDGTNDYLEKYDPADYPKYNPKILLTKKDGYVYYRIPTHSVVVEWQYSLGRKNLNGFPGAQNENRLLVKKEHITYDAKTGWCDFKITTDALYRYSKDIMSGSVYLSALDADKNVLWSWHIWIKGSEKNVVYDISKIGTNQVMHEMALGATTNFKDGDHDQNFGNEHGMHGMLYQWGRKDPFPSTYSGGHEGANVYYRNLPTVYYGTEQRASSVNLANTANQEDYEAFENYVTANNINTLTQYPRTFRTGTIPVNGARNDMWNPNLKTLYDPCPQGYRVPPSNNFYVDQGDVMGTRGYSPIEGEGVNPSEFRRAGRVLTSWRFNGDNISSTRDRIAAFGYRDRNDGKLYAQGAKGYYWSAAANGLSKANYYEFGPKKVEFDDIRTGLGSSDRNNAYGIRCMKE